MIPVARLQSYLRHSARRQYDTVLVPPQRPAHVFQLSFDGIKAIGIATREPFRRQEVASALTAQVVRAAFGRGAEVVCLTAADERAGRLYGHIGFRPCATMLAYADEQAKQGANPSRAIG